MKRCDTCTKRVSSRKCKVLHKMIGLKQECWAWSDDPGWEAEVQKAREEYELVRQHRRKGEK